jgi:hypothetical protein
VDDDITEIIRVTLITAQEVLTERDTEQHLFDPLDQRLCARPIPAKMAFRRQQGHQEHYWCAAMLSDDLVVVIALMLLKNLTAKATLGDGHPDVPRLHCVAMSEAECIAPDGPF